MKRFLLRGTAVLVGASAIALGATTITSAQSGGVSGTLAGWQSPAQGTLSLTVTGRTSGDAKLLDATLSVDGATLDVRSLCPASSDCQFVTAAEPFKFKTTDYPDGVHHLNVTIRDDAGESFAIDRDIEVWNNRPTGSPTATLNIGSGSAETPGAQSPGTKPGGAVEGASATSCRSPRLSMLLDQKPLRVSKGVPVLLKNRRYRFTGRLTCLVGSKRKSAATGAKISLRSVVGRRTAVMKGTTVKAGGKITLILRYSSSRTLEFRYTNGEGKTSKVRIKVRIAQSRKG